VDGERVDLGGAGGRTALTLLSKPVTRRQFILGKFLGIVWAVGILFLVLGLVLLVTISRKVVFDARDAAYDEEITWQLCHREMVRTVPGLLLGWMETVVLTSVSVAISTRLPMLANLVISGSIYVLGNLAPLMISAGGTRLPVVTFMGQLIATILPVLDHYRIPGAVEGEAVVPVEYLLWAGGYSALYATLAMLLALALFEDRDLA
jgi:hypothetical protein